MIIMAYTLWNTTKSWHEWHNIGYTFPSLTNPWNVLKPALNKHMPYIEHEKMYIMFSKLFAFFSCYFLFYQAERTAPDLAALIKRRSPP
jgi:hypothetical protein